MIEEGGLPTHVATQLLGFVLTAWPRSKREGQPLGSNPASIHRGEGSQGPGRKAAATPQGDTPGRSVGPTAGGGASQDATWGLKRRLLLKQLTENKASPSTLEGPGGQREGHLCLPRHSEKQAPRNLPLKAQCSLPSKPSLPGGATQEVARGDECQFSQGGVRDNLVCGIWGQRGHSCCQSQGPGHPVTEYWWAPSTGPGRARSSQDPY